MKLGEVIGPHDPDKMHQGIAPLKKLYCRPGVGRAQVCLKAGNNNAWVLAYQGFGGGNAGLQRRQASVVLERVTGRNNPPESIQLKPL